MRSRILILYDAPGPQIEPLAQAVARGVAVIEGATPLLRHVTDAQQRDLLEADAIILGCPNWSGITGRLKTWLDEQGDLWEEGTLAGKVGAAFVIGRGRHSGLEFTLLELLHWMLAGGMVIVGLPWSDEMRTSGSYYGATAAGGVQEEDLAQARALGARVARVSLALKSGTGGHQAEMF